MNKQKTIAFDLDDVLCYEPEGYEHLGPEKYDYCKPYNGNIDLVNSLYNDGYKIVIYTARGMSQFKGNIVDIYTHLYNRTNQQLTSWGLKYHSLIMGKIHYDVLIDDKVLNSHNINKKHIVEFIND